MDNTYKLYILGSRGTHSVFGDEFKVFGGQTSCYVIKHDDYALIVDCGTGLYSIKGLLSDCKKIDILLTHVHYDHIIGLLNESAFPKDAEYNFYGNFSKWSQTNIFDDFFKKPFWPVNNMIGKLNDIQNNGNSIQLTDSISFSSYNSNHPDDTSVYVINVNNKKVCILSDFENSNGFDTKVVNNADYLLYDGMFDVDEYEKRIGWGHSSWLEGCKLAKKENVKNLVITHHSPLNDDKTLLEMENKCRKEFANSSFARFGDIYQL